MKVLFDNQCFYYNGVGGVSRFFYEIIKGLEKFPFINVSYQNHPLIQKYDNDKVLKRLELKGLSRIRLEIEKYFNKREIIKVLKSEKINVFIPSYYDVYFLPFLGNTKLIIVIHDLICEKYNLNSIESRNKLKLLDRADVIICVSETTKKELLSYYPQFFKKEIEIVYHGNSLTKLKPSLINLESANFGLFVGNRHGYKNFKRLLIEISDFLKDNPTFHLVCVGGKSFTKQEKALLTKLKVYTQVKLVNCNDSSLKWLYQNAQFYLSASAEEGFGIPLVEAMASGCLLVLNEIDVYHEVSNDNALFFDINKEHSLYNVLKDYKSAESMKIRAKAKKFSSNYSWESTVKTFSNILSNK